MKLLAQSSYWVLNKDITRALNSLEASLILSLLCDMHSMHPDKLMVFCRQSYLKQETGLSYHRIGKAMDLLQSKNLIYREREVNTLQPKMMYKVLEDNIVDLYRLKVSTSIGENNGGHNNNILYKENTIERNNYWDNINNSSIVDKFDIIINE